MGSAGLPQLQYLIHVAGGVDRYLLRDAALVINTLAKGRFRGFGLLIIRDVFGVSCFIDTLTKYLLENLKELSLTPGVSYKEKIELFTKSVDSKSGNPFNLIN